MPTGFRGEDASKYLQPVSEAMSVARAAHILDPFAFLVNRNVPPPGLPALINRETTHPSSTASSGSYNTGTGSSRNIVAIDGFPYDLIAPVNRIDNEVGTRVHVMIQQLLELCGAHYRIPQTTRRLESILRQIQQSMIHFGEPTETMSCSLSSFTDELGEDLVWNIDDAEDVRFDCEKDMDYQIQNMQESDTSYRKMQATLLEQALDEDGVALTATKWISQINRFTEKMEWIEVADDVARMEAKNRAEAYREQAGAALSRAIAIGEAVSDLENERDTTNTLFQDLETEIVSTDQSQANRMLTAADKSNAYKSWVQEISSSFSDVIPMGGAGVLINALHSFDPSSGGWLNMATPAELALLDAIRESGIPFPNDWTELDKLKFARRYLAETRLIQIHIDTSFLTTDYRVDADIAKAAETTFLFLSGIDIAFHLTLEQRLEVLQIYTESARSVNPLKDYLKDLGFSSDNGSVWSILSSSDIEGLATKIVFTHTAAENGTSYQDWFAFLAAGSWIEGAAKTGRAVGFLNDLQKNWQVANATKPPQSARSGVSGVQAILSNKTLTNVTSNGLKQYTSPVRGSAAAQADFNKLNLRNVRTYPNGTVVGYLPNGNVVNLHPSKSMGGIPTLEIYDPITRVSIKIRY